MAQICRAEFRASRMLYASSVQKHTLTTLKIRIFERYLAWWLRKAELFKREGSMESRVVAPRTLSSVPRHLFRRRRCSIPPPKLDALNSREIEFNAGVTS